MGLLGSYNKVVKLCLFLLKSPRLSDQNRHHTLASKG
uniref:Uncharacterized protein n=1 Tax=Arundo donax TaxID=35708 RepID=A0A0A9CGU8_ARUDO